MNPNVNTNETYCILEEINQSIILEEFIPFEAAKPSKSRIKYYFQQKRIENFDKKNTQKLEFKTKISKNSIYFITFVYVFASALYSITLPNILIFRYNISPQTLGIVSSIGSIAYLIGPFVLRKFSTRIGLKKSILLTISITTLTIFIELTYLTIPILIICHLVDGLFGTLFWPNIQNSISIAQNNATKLEKKIIFKKFGLSWNIGAILGDFTGFLIVTAGLQDFSLLKMSGVLFFILIPTILKTRFPKKLLMIENPTSKIVPVKNKNQSNLEMKSKSPIKNNTNNTDSIKPTIEKLFYLAFPLWYILGGEFIFQFFKTVFVFIFPIFLNDHNISPSFVFLIVLLQQITQIVGIFLSEKLTPRKKFLLFIGSLFLGAIMSFLLGIFSNIGFYYIMMIGVGLLSGFLYVFPAKMFFYRSHESSNLKLASYYEIFSALGYGIAPLFGGYLYNGSINSVFLILGFIMVGAFILLSYIGIRSILSKSTQKNKNIFKILTLSDKEEFLQPFISD